MDHQVKIRGFRIELGEIEAALRECPGVDEAVVLTHETAGAERRLVAYVAHGSAGPPPATDLRSQLASKLPAYMVPSSWAFLEALPLTPNGKVDRRALAQMEGEAETGRDAIVAPRTPTEKAVAAIWTDVIGVSVVGVHDNFFDVGGHSLDAARIVSRLRSVFGIDIVLRTLFERPTVAGLSEIVDAMLLLADAPGKGPADAGREETEI